MNRKKVFIVDDSSLIRRLLADILTQSGELEVVGMASDPYQAWEQLQTLAPDVMTLDVEMPKMDGLSFLEKLMAERPMPVVMVSSLTDRGAQTTLRALEIGAIDYVCKPRFDNKTSIHDLAEEIVSKVKTAASARLRRAAQRVPVVAKPVVAKPVLQPTPRGGSRNGSYRLLAIGASTGGTEALFEFLTELPAEVPGIAIVQHMPPGFTKNLADRLNRYCRFEVREARDGDRLGPGVALIAPGGYHLEVVHDAEGLLASVTSRPPVNRFRPSVDVLFQSCADLTECGTLGVILTGMGRDGADGMRAMLNSGAYTIAQDEASCVVFGMPKEAIAAGGVREVLPLEKIAGRITQLLDPGRNGAALAALRAASNLANLSAT
jgi:two-component system, chemotaxis family, protein-glutamate methylesterase/glutaminase